MVLIRIENLFVEGKGCLVIVTGFAGFPIIQDKLA
jgi:hypothetical protein